MQDLIAILLVLACVAYVARQLLKTVRAGNGKAGSCCTKGCGGQDATPSASTPTPTPTREQFIPVDSLRRRRA